MEKEKIKFILASASPRRKELLGYLQVPIEIVSSNVSEESEAKDPVKFSAEIANLKGSAVFEQRSDNCLVVSADTIVFLEGKIFGKPGNVFEAREMLNELSGKTHSVFTAVSVKLRFNNRKEEFSFVEESKVTFNPISLQLMEHYLATKDSLDKAGAYGIQGPSLTFISKVQGDYANVVGFPLSRFIVELEKFLKPITSSRSWCDLF